MTSGEASRFAPPDGDTPDDPVDWATRPQGGWAEFTAARERFLLRLAVDAALRSEAGNAGAGAPPTAGA